MKRIFKAVYGLINNKSKSMEYIYPAQLKMNLKKAVHYIKPENQKTFTLSRSGKKVEKTLKRKTFTIIQTIYVVEKKC